MDSYLGAIDLGGTKIISACFSPEGELLHEPVETPTGAGSSPEEIIDNICANLDQSLARCGISADRLSHLGLGVPTTVQYDKGLIDPSPNLPTMSDFPLGSRLSGKLSGVTVTMENDANCFALGEATCGAAAGSSTCCGITLGTGLGLGLVIEGKVYHGSHWCAGEIWKCAYGDGILEDKVRGASLARAYRHSTGNELTCEQVHLEARQGDQAALDVFLEMGRHLGRGLSYLVNILDPEVIIFGGSVSQAFDLFIEPLEQEISRHRIKRNSTRFVKAKLGKLAPLYGAVFCERKPG
ncbi:MAG: ROK family protein [Gemmatimonadota bacterium]|nr:ROK family protein [Gemmatimonadota bacterium]